MEEVVRKVLCLFTFNTFLFIHYILSNLLELSHITLLPTVTGRKGNI